MWHPLLCSHALPFCKFVLPMHAEIPFSRSRTMIQSVETASLPLQAARQVARHRFWGRCSREAFIVLVVQDTLSAGSHHYYLRVLQPSERCCDTVSMSVVGINTDTLYFAKLQPVAIECTNLQHQSASTSASSVHDAASPVVCI